MAVQKSNLQGFTSEWQKTAAWAQSQGISKNSYYPIYQMDSARLLSTGHGMSQPERTRAILAAANPNQVNRVSADKPDPTNVMGNAVSDARNIFTGLAPNHLIGNIFDTVKNTIVHPSTVIKPLEDVAGGVISGNMTQVKQGLELGAGLKGPGSILSWLPGVYVAGEVAQGGVGEALSHPVVSFLDVAPFAPAGKVVAAAADESRVASMAARLGTTSDALRAKSMPAMAAAWAMHTKVADLPDIISNRAPALIDPVTKQPLTIGGALDNWIRDRTGMGKTYSALMKGMVTTNHEKTEAEVALFRPAQMSLQALDSDKERNRVFASIAGLDPETKGKTQAEIRADGNLDQKMRTAIDLNQEPLYWATEMSVASGGTVPVARPDGTIALVHSAGEHNDVVAARDQLAQDRNDLIRAMGPNHRIVQEGHQLDLAGDELQTKIDRTSQQAEADVAALHGQDRFMQFPTEVGKRPRIATLDLRRQANELFGGPESKIQGIVYQAQKAVIERDWATVKTLSAAVNRRLERSGVGSLDADLSPALTVLKGQFMQLHEIATKQVTHERNFTKEFQKDGKFGKTPTKVRGSGKVDPAVQQRYETAKEAFDRDLTSERARQEFDAASKALESARFDANRERWVSTRDKMQNSFARYLSSEAKFAAMVRDHPTGEWVDVIKQKFIENLLAQEKDYHRLEDFAQALKTRGIADERIQRLRQDPVKFAQWMVLSIRALGNNPFGDQILPASEEKAMWTSAIAQANKLRAQGETPQWLPRVTSLDIRDTDPGRFGIHIASTGKARRSTRAFARKVDLTAQRDDLVAALHLAGKEQLAIDGTIEFAETHLSQHLASGTEMLDMITRGGSGLDDIYEHYIAQGSNPIDAVERIMHENFKMKRFDASNYFGFTLPRWTADPMGQYIPEAIADALPKMLDRGQFPLDGVYQKATGLFRFSILKMSPRYTAHVTIGGTFLLALRSSPHIVRAIPEAVKIMRNEGEVPRSVFERTAPQFGVEPMGYITTNDNLRNKGSQVFHKRTGSDMARLNAEEDIVENQKVPLKEAKAWHYLTVLGEMNYKFTNRVAAFQRATAYADYALSNEKKKTFTDPVTGETFGMTADRAHQEAMQHVYKVFGDQEAMTPLERGTFATIMPFYGWTKHILQYVFTYPADHPFRAATLAVMATQNSDSIASGLPKRLQFLYFLGSPDVQGNVSAIDVRSMDPLRDVANYATLGGWISSLNPVITAPLAMVDPQIIFGGNPLYPNVTYDQFYGIETAGAQGSPLTAAEQFVPQISALQTALTQSGNYRKMAATNPNQFAKDIFGALNIPFAQVQHINLKQIAGKDAIDRYKVASAAAQSAFESGNFSAISKLGSVPDPQNPDYEVSPSYLAQLYAQLQAQYPGQAPSETATPPPPANI